MNSKVITKVIGGLGNQLFQYAFGYHLSRTLEAELLVDHGGFQSYDLHEFLLTDLALDVHTCQPKDLKLLGLFGKNRISQAVSKRLLNITPGHRYVRERDARPTATAFAKARWIYLDGYWQSHEYLESIRPEILAMFTTKKAVPMPEFLNSKKTVGIHIRRGDYLSLACVLPLSYYRKAFDLLKSRLGSDLIPIIFSDDPAWVSDNLRLSPNQIQMEKGTTLSDFVNFQRCQHHIIANSTFSWWAAWLNDSPDKQVLLPAQWFRGPEFNVQDLAPPKWQVVDC